MDRVNKTFAFLAKPHWGKYVLLFLILGILFFSFHPFPKDIKADFFTHHLYIAAIICFAMCGCFCFIFYSVEDRNFLDKRWRGGIPATDSYFYIKINSDITVLKKFFGYAYVILKVLGYGGLGYILAIGLFALANLKG